MSDRSSANDRLFQHLLQTTQQGYWHIANDTRTIDVNPAMCRLLGLPKEEIVGRTIFEFVDTENAEVFRREIEARKQGKQGSYEVALRRADGTNVPCVNNASTVLDEAGRKIASIGLWTDISEIKNVQNLLIEAKEEAEKANRAKSDFLSSMSHELRTPLHALLGFAELLMTDTQNRLSGVQQDYADRILRSGDHLLNLIDGVLDLTEIESGNVSLSIGAFAPGVVLARSVEIGQSIADRNGITLVNLTAGKIVGAVRADATRLQQVLLNLLSNAIKYNREGGTATLDCMPLDGEMMRFIVSDTGNGIPLADQEQLFVPFRRLGMEKGSIEGAGVGLTISRSLVEQMGGKLSFESHPDQGSSFFVDLPRAEEGEVIAVPTAGAGKDSCGPKIADTVVRTVLYIEDNPDLVQLMENILKRQSNLAMISAHNAETGLVLVEKMAPDIILMDINLPGMNGLDALHQLKSDPNTDKIPIVAVSGAAMQDDVDQGTAAGFDAYLTKPFRMREVVATINELLTSG